MGYDPTVCYNSIVSQGKGPCPNELGTGSAYHCLDAQESGPIHEFCSQAGNYYSPFQYSEAYNPSKCLPNEYNAVKCDEKVFANINDLVDYLLANPGMKSRPCYCCCSCLAYGTPIAIPSGMKSIENIIRGEEVLAASMTSSGGNLSFTWAPSTVIFSQGTPPSDPRSGIASTMIFIFCEFDQGLICTPDQLLMTASGKLKQAQSLVPGDQLVTPLGKPITIQSLKMGNWYGGIHHIALENTYSGGDLNGHLINAGNFVVADFSVQLDPLSLGEMFEAGPAMGTKEYDEAQKTTLVRTGVYTHKSAKLAKGAKEKLPRHFQLFSEQPAPIPPDAQSFITYQQAIDIVANRDAHFRPYGNKSGVDSLKYLFQLYKGFFPDYNFYLDWDNISPNAYAFMSYGVKTVVISGGLVRLDGLYFEGLAFIIAQCIARLLDVPVYKGPRPLPTIQADYYGMELVMQQVWYFNAPTMNSNAIDQIKAFWAYIAPDDQKGDPKDPQEYPSISCRTTTLMYAQLGGGLPPCAQPPLQPLEVTDAEAGDFGDGQPYVNIAFSNTLDQVTAQVPDNYTFKPAVEISSVAVLLATDNKVQIVANLKADQEYVVTVKNVKGAGGESLDPGKNSATFTAE